MTPAEAGQVLALLRDAFPTVQMSSAERDLWLTSLAGHRFGPTRSAIGACRWKLVGHPSLDQFLAEVADHEAWRDRADGIFPADDAPVASPETTRAGLSRAREALRGST